MCRHRGNRIVRTDAGNARNFACAYHGWTYSNQGELEYLPGEEEAYYGALDRDCLSLVEARLDTYAGIVFATWDQEAPSLDDYLGDARWLLDVSFNRLDHGTEALGPIKWIEPVNWKTAVDNCSDNYHVPTTHLSAIIVQGRHRGIPRLTHEQQFQSESKHLFVNGHSLTMRFLERPDQARQTHGITAENREAFEEYYRQTLAESERRLGSLRARRLQLGNHSLFPNGVLGLRLAHPRGPQQTEFWHFVVLEKDMPEELKTALRRGSANYNGVNGIFEQDDMDNWRGVTNSALSPMGRKLAQNLSMGVGHDRPHPDYPGVVAERYTSESNQRLFYQRWEQFMNAENWEDIPLEPKVMDFEGTATLLG
jgi:phenylpropionate dioxygenase-like ring-hydroxylating dioxygenase large terminal subunit